MPTRGQLLLSGGWQVDLDRGELRAHGALVPIGSRAFEILVVLIEAAGELVTKDELMNRIWPGAIVEENTLHAHVSAVRRALGPDRGMLATVSGRGYRLGGTWVASEQPRPDPIQSAAVHRDAEATAATAFATNLPAAAGRLIGRETVAEQLAELLSAYRTVTLTGPGGIGKTALALEIARRAFPGYQGDAWIVELASLSDPALVPSAVAAALGLTLASGAISPEAVARSIGGKKLLMVLDNCEHVIDAAARFAETLVRLCPRATILATSREVLRIEGEHVYRVPPLDVPPPDQAEPGSILRHGAVALFVARTMAAQSTPAPRAEDLHVIASLCRRLDGIPLAIEFAAARVATLGLEQVVARLDDRFGLLTGGRRTALPRHQTLRATLDWSYELLPEPEQRLLRRLAVFAGGFTPEAAAAVASDPDSAEAAVIEAIGNLVAKSLVTRDRAASALRWRLLETIRAYALEKLQESGEAARIARRHAQFFRDRIAPATIGPSPASVADVARYAEEIDDVRAALDWSFAPEGDLATGIVLTAAYVRVWHHLGLAGERRDRTQHALDRLAAYPGVSDAVRMWLHLGHASSLGYTLGSPARAGAMAQAALEAAERLGDPRAQLWPLHLKWAAHAGVGDCRAAQQAAERLSRVALRLDDPEAILLADRLLGAALLFGGSQREARARLERGLERFVEPQAKSYPPAALFDQSLLARSLLALGLWLEGLVDTATAQIEACFREASARDSKFTLCEILRSAGCRVAIMNGDVAAAERPVARLIDVATANSLGQYLQAGRCFEGMLLIKRGALDRGTAALREALADCSAAGWTTSFPEFLGVLAEGLGGLGQAEAGLDTVAQAMTRAERGGERWYLPELLRIKGELLQAADRSTPSAEQCFHDALAAAREQGALSWELRAATSLARLRASQDRPDEARDALAPVYARFTEGFATADLRAARALLDIL